MIKLCDSQSPSNNLTSGMSLEPFHSQDLISNSPYSLPYNSYDVSLENMVLDQPQTEVIAN